MSTSLLVVIIVIVLFLTIVLFDVRFKIKQKRKACGGSKSVEERKQKREERKSIRQNTKKEIKEKRQKKSYSDRFVRPIDRIRYEEQQQNSEITQANTNSADVDADGRIRRREMGEGISDSDVFSKESEELSGGDDSEILADSVSDEIKNLSPEMKAMIFGDVFKRKE